MRTYPTDGLVAKLRHLDAAAGSSVEQVREPALDGSGQLGDDDEARLAGFEPFDQPVVIKPFVGADYNRTYTRRELDEAGFEQIKNSGGGIGIAGPQFAVPEVTTMTL